MIDFYYWPTPNGWKVSILLEELSINYNTIFVNIGQGDQFKPDFLKINPNACRPLPTTAATATLFPYSSPAPSCSILHTNIKNSCPASHCRKNEVLEWLF